MGDLRIKFMILTLKLLNQICIQTRTVSEFNTTLHAKSIQLQDDLKKEIK
ncbi:hypothetical protein LCGC14_0359160 [marine sediment metagenome]|uniref:Uncharacterized protein n=1 Tax=marine sediment metagenome TaxID=412755 RepID=A0A0F9VVM8_9ZZZZ